MREAQSERVQKLVPEAEIALHAVRRVTADGKIDRCEVDADLMCPSGFEPDVEKSVLAQRLGDLEPGDRFARLLRVERVLRRITPIAPDRSFDLTGARPRMSLDERQVPALDLPPPNR